MTDWQSFDTLLPDTYRFDTIEEAIKALALPGLIGINEIKLAFEADGQDPIIRYYVRVIFEKEVPGGAKEAIAAVVAGHDPNLPGAAEKAAAVEAAIAVESKEAAVLVDSGLTAEQAAVVQWARRLAARLADPIACDTEQDAIDYVIGVLIGGKADPTLAAVLAEVLAALAGGIGLKR